MEDKIVFATGNEGKMREIRSILSDLGLPVLSMKEAGVSLEIEENGTTFGENAEIKARAVWEQTGGIVLADDSGLVVDYLGGEPGIYSARYLGEDTSYEVKNRTIIDRLKEAREEERSARFVCNIAAVLPDGSVAAHRGDHGGKNRRGAHGKRRIRLRSHFVASGIWKDIGGDYHDEKNRISHRGKALRAMREALVNWLGKDKG